MNPHPSASPSPARARVPLFVQVLAGAVLGGVVGAAFGAGSLGPLDVSTGDLGDAGMLVIRALKMLATPLIFLAVIDGLLRFEVPRRKGATLVVISAVNACVAVAIGLGLAHALGMGEGAFTSLAHALPAAATATGPATASPDAPHALSAMTSLRSFVPESVIAPFAQNAVISIVALALLIGAALRTTRVAGDEELRRGVDALAAVVRASLAALVRILGWAVALVPLAVFGVVASVVGRTGWDLAGGLVSFLFTMVLGLFLHAVVYYSFVLAVIARRSPLGFFRGALDAITTAMSCGSSLATLPVTLRCLQEMKVSPGSARLATCVGSNLNHDGIILYEAAAAIFVAQAFGIHMDGTQQLAVAVAAVVAGIGIAGIPEAGLVTLPLVLGAAGLPAPVVATVVPALLPVDWMIGRCRATTNVLSDMTVAAVLDRVSPDETALAVAQPYQAAPTKRGTCVRASMPS